MIWCRFQKGNSISYGIVESDTVTAVEGDPFTKHHVTADTFPLSDVTLKVPVLPGTFYAIGSNYRNHVEGRAKVKGTAPIFYETPRVGYRANSALIASGETIVKPCDAGPHFEYEAELVAVIGKTVRNVTPAEATSAIFGWTIGNDVTERDWQKADPTNLRAKNSDTFKPMGPWIATGIDPAAMTTNVRRNGKTLHSFATGNMLFSPGEVISAISNTTPFRPATWSGSAPMRCPRASILATSWRSRSPASAH
jgi:2-keto-4-pentenoate hydratase/2-oxohepta-3-ene-1,7-dioic acid hydratase in catechol pathway